MIAVDRGAIHALGCVPMLLEDLLEAFDLAFGLAQMRFESLLQLGIGRLADHLGQGLQDLVFSVVNVLQRVDEQIVERLDVSVNRPIDISSGFGEASPSDAPARSMRGNDGSHRWFRRGACRAQTRPSCGRGSFARALGDGEGLAHLLDRRGRQLVCVLDDLLHSLAGVGSMVSCRLFASATSSGSSSAFMNAVRRAATRSAGMPSGAI